MGAAIQIFQVNMKYRLRETNTHSMQLTLLIVGIIFKGYAGPWVEHPTQFSNEYAADMIEDEWTLVSHGDTWLDAQGAAELRPAPGKRQFVNKVPGKIDDDEPNQMMLLSDMVLAWDPSFRSYLEVYAEDENKLKIDFGAAFKKLTELGCGF